MTNCPPQESYTIYEGRSFAVEWYYTEKGEMPAHEFYKEMEERLRARFLALVKYLADASYGTFLPKTDYNIEDRRERIYAFKPHRARFFNFMTKGKRIVVTNAFYKHSQKLTKQDRETLGTAMRYKEDYFERNKRGEYYEKK